MIDMLKNLGQTLSGKADEVELSDEEKAAQDKADRIDFHRKNVRNGPVSFKTITAGQERRTRERAVRKIERKNFRAEVRNYFERQRVAAVLRGHLQAVGLIAYVDGHEADMHDQIVSTAWINQRWGSEVIVDNQGTGHVSFSRDGVLDALRSAAEFYEKATGLIVRVPVDFEPAIHVDES